MNVAPPFIGILILALVLGVAWRMWWLYRRGSPLPTPYAAIPVRLVQVGEWQFRYHISGRGPAVVLLHGIGANLFCWRGLVPYLNTRYTVVALDLPGFGQSSKPTAVGYGLDDQAARLKRFLDQMGIQPHALVGNSMGGNIALWYALTYPTAGLGTVVIAPASSPSLMPLNAARWHWLAPPIAKLITRPALRWAHRRTVVKKNLVDQGRVNETYQTYKSDPNAVRSFLLATEVIRDPRLTNRLGDIPGRVLVLWGSEDQLVPRSVVESLAAGLKDSEMQVHHGGGHHLQEDEPQWVAAKIDTFLTPTRSKA